MGRSVIIFSVIALFCVWELELQLFAAEQCTSTHRVSTADSHISRVLWLPDLMFICRLLETGKSVEIIHMWWGLKSAGKSTCCRVSGFKGSSHCHLQVKWSCEDLLDRLIFGDEAAWFFHSAGTTDPVTKCYIPEGSYPQCSDSVTSCNILFPWQVSKSVVTFSMSQNLLHHCKMFLADGEHYF